MARSYPTTRMCDGEFLAQFEPTTRDSDVFLTTSAKCGQTWLQSLLFHMKTHGREPDYRGVGIHGVSPWLEIPIEFMPLGDADRAAKLARLERLDDPRVFKMHVVWDEVPRPPGSRARIMTITRDPRDVPYSMFNHMQALAIAGPPPTDFATWFEPWFQMGFYFKFVASMWPHRHDPDVLWLRYEDLHRDLAGEARRIADFLGWPVDEADIDRVLPLVGFEHMQANERGAILGSVKTVWREDKQFFREGGVGKNRAHLNADQERRIIERFRNELGDECCAFLFDGT
jgi:aryl sulfotransferase